MKTILRVWYREVWMPIADDMSVSIELPTLPVKAEIVDQMVRVSPQEGRYVWVLIRYTVADQKMED